MKLLIVVFTVLLALGQCGLPTLTGVESSFKVQTDLTGCTQFAASKVSVLKAQGFVKFVCPFGLLMAADAGMPDQYLLYAANVFANLVDRDGDGKADCPDVVKKMLDKKIMAAGGSTQAAEKKADVFSGQSELGSFYSFSFQAWKGIDAGYTAAQTQTIIFEEMFHMTHQYGWAQAFPAQLGVTGWTSTVGKQVAAVACTKPGWWHSENKCGAGAPFAVGKPAKVPLTGTCSDPNCDVVEFYHQALLLHIGAQPGWWSEYMPRTKAGVDAILTADMKAVMDGAAYCQISKKPGNNYKATVAAVTASASTSTTAPAKTGDSMIGFNFLLAISYLVYTYLK